MNTPEEQVYEKRADVTEFRFVGEFPPLRRQHMLLDGRRVQVRDLMDAGLLTSGTRLRFDQTKNGPSHLATVQGDASITLDDGRTSRTLSGAARLATGGGSYDGWIVWNVEDGGRSLDSLRRDLLKSKAEEARSAAGGYDGGDVEQSRDDPLEQRFEWLERQRRLVDEGRNPRLSVQQLLTQWGAKGRDEATVATVVTDLANHGLTTRPDFRDVGLDTEVQLSLPPGGATDQESTAGTHPIDDGDGDDALDTGLKIGNLPSALGGLSSVGPSADINEAITLMLVNDYSQVAVLQGEHNLRGAVSWRSIARARNANANATLSEALIASLPVSFEEELLDVLPRIQNEDFIFVKDSKNRVVGIVTAADVVDTYAASTTPFLLLGELDRALRTVIRRHVDFDDVVALCDPAGTRNLQSFSDLSIGDYERILENPAQWQKLGWELDRKAFVAHLRRLREIRNDIMHFNPDPVPEGTIRMTRAMLGVIRQYAASS